MAQNIHDVDFTRTTFGPLERETRLYSVPLKPEITIQTPVVGLASELSSEPGAVVYLHTSGALTKFFQETERQVLEWSLANKGEWFSRAKPDDDIIKSSFKTFITDGKVKVRVHEAFTCFGPNRELLEEPNIPVGAQLRCVLQLTKLSFGRHEFGAMWRLVQARVLPDCMIDDAESVIADGDDDFL